MAVVSNFTALISDYSWTGYETAPGGSAFVTYSFPSAPDIGVTTDYGASAASTWQPLSASAQQLIRNVIAEYASRSGLVFIEVSGQADIEFQFMDFTGTTKSDAAGFANYPYRSFDNTGYSVSDTADVFFNSSYLTNGNNAELLDVAIHEVGHAVGLKHPFDGDPTLTTSLDTTSNTAMSYTGGIIDELGPFDIQAIQYLYGGPGNDASHLSSWSFDRPTETLTQVGGAGSDTIVGVNGRDVLIGGDGNDKLFAGAGNDQVFGGTGADTLGGGQGADIVLGGDGSDQLQGGEGNDQVFAGAGNDYILEYSNSYGNDVLGGGLGQDTMLGGGGNDMLFGGVSNATTAGQDQIQGGDGNDVAFGGRGVAAFENDQIFLWEGNDTAYAGIGNDYVDGDGGADQIFGGDGNDNMYGGVGNDTLWGGAGNDQMNGETGQDTFGFVAGSGSDVIFGYEAGVDRLWFADRTGSYAALRAAATDNGVSTTIDLGGGDSITLSGVRLAELSAADFAFGGMA